MLLRNKETGEIVELKLIQVNDKYLEDHEVDLLNGEKLTLKSLADSFDDVKEPLIKDEKIRKAVRAWAEGSNFQSVHYDAFWTCFRRGNSSITVWEELPLEDNKAYTIDELCGEEEE